MSLVSGDDHPRPCSADTVADILWDAFRYEAPVPEAAPGFKGWHTRNLYVPIVRKRRERVWSHGSGEPWLSAQWALERLSGGSRTRSEVRFEGIPSSDREGFDPERAYRGLKGEPRKPPFLMVAGYPRSGTTSLQNLLLRAFPDHVPAGKWSGCHEQIFLWSYSKHDSRVVERLAGLGEDTARTLICLRDFVDAAASWGVYQGMDGPDCVSREWLNEQVRWWRSFLACLDLPGVVPVWFAEITGVSPREADATVRSRLDLQGEPSLPSDVTWTDLYEDGLSEELLDNPRRSNLPSAERAVLVSSITQRIRAMLGSVANDLADEATQAAIAR